MKTTARTPGRGQKVLLSFALLLAGASFAGVGAYAAFTSSDSVTHSVSTGTVTIVLGATGASTNRLNVDASGLAPGDTIQRSVNLTNSGSLDLTTVTLTTSASPSSALDTDATNGLQVVIDRCSSAWTEAGSSPNFTYTCSGSTSTVLASRAVIGTNMSLSNLTATTAGNTDHLRVRLTLPSSVGNALQGQSSTLTYTFTGTH
jgi:predicted ribosomally synthesized peptide with SipW-like signal peptide